MHNKRRAKNKKRKQKFREQLKKQQLFTAGKESRYLERRICINQFRGQAKRIRNLSDHKFSPEKIFLQEIFLFSNAAISKIKTE
ncbi:MAG: hypothetical protein C0507_19125 [Cyanobacteria bacterium PR.3.49]|nr:hypothetical protein [Cyanobacteria bacterium PR.3.49]